MNAPVGLWIMAVMYILAGVTHFVKPAMYRSIIPPSFPAPQALVWLSGLAEIVLGVALLYPSVRLLAAWGIVLLLILVFPANVYMAMSSKFYRIPGWIRWGRLPLQVVLIAWALVYV